MDNVYLVIQEEYLGTEGTITTIHSACKSLENAIQEVKKLISSATYSYYRWSEVNPSGMLDQQIRFYMQSSTHYNVEGDDVFFVKEFCLV